MVDVKVIIGIPTGEYARRADFYDYRDMLQKPPNSMQISPHSASPATNRNIIVEQAKLNNCSHILFMDDDVAPKPDALMQLLSHNVDVVSAVILRRDYPHQPLLFDQMTDDGRSLYSYLEPNFTERLKPIVAAGMGFILVKTSVFDKMQKPYFRLGELDPCEWCDDIGFFYRLRKETDVKAYCDLECRVGHIGTMIVWPNYGDDKKWYSGIDSNGRQSLNTPQINPLGGSDGN